MRDRGEHTKQQIRELGQTVRKAAREVDRAYPNTTQGDRIAGGFQHQTNRIVQSSRQHTNRSLKPSYQADGPDDQLAGLFLALAPLMVGSFVILLGLLVVFLHLLLT
jgi:hypothetical protein